MTTLTGKTTRVIGWYHSHPHITVLPSHVDVRTQAMYQLLDSGFIGLIFSCFSEDVTKVGRIQVIAFQSSDGKQHHTPIYIPLTPTSRSSIIGLESSPGLWGSISNKSPIARIEDTDQNLGDSRTSVAPIKDVGISAELGGFFANADANSLENAKAGGNHQQPYLDNPLVDVDPMDMSESMQEAMHRSNLDLRGAEYVRKEVPLQVLPVLSLIKLDSPLTSFTDLQRVLFEEERGAYNQAISQNAREGKVHPLTFIHHTSTYQASMCKLMEYCLSPAISALHDRLRENEIRLGSLIEESRLLETEILTTRESSSAASPRHMSSHGGRGSGFNRT
uniref:MPN domain-containing protein n=1 Tax=Kalanchoe fedtschenkoi TaxID=63787 RepID=A0A7N0RGP5_KALFE